MNPTYHNIAQFLTGESPVRANLDYFVWVGDEPLERTARKEKGLYVPIRGFQIQGKFLLDETQTKEFPFIHRSVNREEVRRYLRKQEKEIAAEFSTDPLEYQEYRQLAGNCINSLVAFMDALSKRRIVIAGRPQLGQTTGWMCSVKALEAAKKP